MMKFFKESLFVSIVAAAAFGDPHNLILWAGSDNVPAYLMNKVDYVETLPFDGIAVFVGTPNPVMSQTLISYNTVYVTSGLSALASRFKKFTQNYLIITVSKPADFFGNWSATIQNFKTYAQAARDAKFAGIFFDNEEYSTPLWGYPNAVDSSSKYSLDQYRAQARLRGKQIMEAMVSVFPNIKVITAHGPYASESAPGWVNGDQTGNNEPSRYGMMGPFFIGMVEGQSTTGVNIDGGEAYKFRTVSDFNNSYQWRKYTIASSSQNSPNIPATLKPYWPEKVSISFGLYNMSWPDPIVNVMNPAIMRTTAENAMRRADQITWFFCENQNWFIPPGSGGVSQDWINAITGARNAVTSMRGEKNLIRLKPALNIRTISNGVIEFRSNVEKNNSLQLSIFDIVGKKIWYQRSIFGNSIVWHTRNGNSRIGDGVYFAILQQKGMQTTQKFIRVR